MFSLEPSQVDRHLIRYEVLSTKANKDVFHHLIMYECDERLDFSSDPNMGHECGNVRPQIEIQRCLGSQIVAVWVCLITIKLCFFP